MPTTKRTDGYLPLRSYAIVGAMRGAALVAADGAIDWLALPVMDAPPLCSALLDPAGGGSIDLQPTVPFEVTRRYLDAVCRYTGPTGPRLSTRLPTPGAGG